LPISGSATSGEMKMAFNWRKMRGLDVANLAISNVTQTRNPFDRAPSQGSCG
jgi:hypothetical protein